MKAPCNQVFNRALKEIGQKAQITEGVCFPLTGLRILALSTLITYELIKLGDVKLQKKLFAAFLFVFFYLLFNAIYEQSGGSLSLFAKDNLSNKLLFFTIDPNVVNNSSNTFFVVALSPLIGLLWIWLGKRKIEPNTLIKFGIGFLFLGASFYIFYLTKFFANAKGIASLNVFTFAYLNLYHCLPKTK